MLTPKETLLLKIANAHIHDFNNDMIDYWSADNYALHNQLRTEIKALTNEYENTYHENPAINWYFDKNKPEHGCNIDKIYETAIALTAKMKEK